MLIVDASYGKNFTLNSPAAVRVDIPIDRPSIALGLSKSASRGSAVPGDVVFYTVTATNNDPARPKRDVVLVDTPSSWLRLRGDSVRIDGTANANAVTPSADGKSLTVRLGTLLPGATRKVTYAMTVRPDAPAGQAMNRAETVDARGNHSIASAALRIESDTISSRMTLIGRITAGDCSVRRDRPGIPGVRVVLEDGSFAITDQNGRYHFEGLVPGTHVVQAQAVTLPEGGKFIDCSRSTRNAGSASSRFVIGQGGSLQVADFSATVPVQTVAAATDDKPDMLTDREAAGGETDWLALGNGPTDWLFPAADHNPRAPAVRVVIRHQASQKVDLLSDGKPVDAVSFDGSRKSADGTWSVSIWRAIPIPGESIKLTAIVRNADGSVATTLNRDVNFTGSPAQVQIVREASRLTADGATRPVVVVRILDRAGRPVHAGISGDFAVNAPYESAQALDAMQSRQLSGLSKAAPQWTVKGDDGLARIELAPTMVSGALRLDFTFADRDVKRHQTLEGWVVPGDQKWTLVGLAEGAAGSRDVADNMERTGRFDSDLGDNARVAFYAKGRVLGRFLLTAAYDSAKQPDDQRLLGTIDPNAYYTVFADGSDRRFDAASRNKLYVRIESRSFTALFGDFETGFDQTQLARYQRTTTGVKAELTTGGLHAQGFVARVASTHRHDEIQGGGISGPYRLSSRAMLANSEQVSLVVRDRLRSELIVSSQSLTRFVDYDIDLLSGTITFKQPVLSRDADLNPQFIVVDYEVDSLTGGKINAGVRADWTTANGKLRVGGTVITDQGELERTNLAALDVKARVGEGTEIRAEVAASRYSGTTSTAWLIEAEHHDGRLDVLAYARSADKDFGVGQMSGAERGRRKFGADARYNLTKALSVTGSAWYDDSLTENTHREAAQLRTDYRTASTDARLMLTSLSDTLIDGSKAASTVLEAGATQRFLNNRLELDASTSLALGKTESIDLPARHRFSARYAINSAVKLVGTYEIANGDVVSARSARAGVEVMPWKGARAVTSIGQQDISEYGKRSYAVFGLSQSLELTRRLSVDATVESNKTLGNFDATKLVNRDHPASSGGNLGEAGTVTEDFTAITLGGTYRAGRWSATVRGELRDGEYGDRKGVTFGAIRQLGEGSMVGSGVTWTRATTPNGAMTETLNAAISAAHRPDNSAFAFLTKIEYRADVVRGAVAGEAGGAGRTALTVTGDAESRRLIGSFSGNWSPSGHSKDDGFYHRSEVGFFLGARHNFDSYEGFDLAGTTVLGGLDARIGLGEKLELGAIATVRHSLTDHVTSFAIGPQIGFSPTTDVLLTVGYNVAGFRDRDFAAARTTDNGFYTALRMKFDADSFSFLGLGR
jgi:uncharacterized repeat protein (TIGR01451 family)